VLFCHRRADRPWYPDVWDLPGGHVRDGEAPAEGLARELREELAIEIEAPGAEPVARIVDEDLDLTIWTVAGWRGDPTNAAPEEHDAIRWVEMSEIDSLRLAHPRYPELIRPAIGGARSGDGG
jgi:ADP-ribose pyrophosphatase YjhB (NUDIX family)